MTNEESEMRVIDIKRTLLNLPDDLELVRQPTIYSRRHCQKNIPTPKSIDDSIFGNVLPVAFWLWVIAVILVLVSPLLFGVRV
jgi:hypothetical protein